MTVRLREGLPTLRSRSVLEVLYEAFGRSAGRFGARLAHFSAQSNHVHMVVEAGDAAALSRGMQGLLIRIARALNRLWHRSGRVFSDRYHARVLRTPREVRNVLVYVLQNWRKHARERRPRSDIDPCSSGPWFDGWSEGVDVVGTAPAWFRRVVLDASTWLLSAGWKLHGLVRPDEGPAAPRSA